MRQIDADKFKQQIAAMTIKNNYPANKANALYKLIDSQPTVEAEPVRQGHIVWKERTVGGYKYAETKCENCGSIMEVEVEHPIETKVGYCSKCGKRLDDNFMHYCPNCGTRVGDKK